jgi:hypothetical protein
MMVNTHPECLAIPMVLLASFGTICLILIAAAALTAIWTASARERERERDEAGALAARLERRKGGAA